MGDPRFNNMRAGFDLSLRVIQRHPSVASSDIEILEANGLLCFGDLMPDSVTLRGLADCTRAALAPVVERILAVAATHDRLFAQLC